MKVYRGTLEKPIVFPESIIITAENLDSIDFARVIYCEISPKGAMGNEGGILIYVLKDEDTLITFETNVEVDAQAFDAVSERISQNANLFINYYGGMGNYVYAKKNVQLEIDEKYNCFWYHSQNTKLRIDSSVQGVFLAVVAEMTGKNSGMNQNKQNQNIKRNSFIALCDYASQNNWCWKLFCTTCGHSAFKVAFSKLIQDQHPENDSFWPYGRSNSDPLKEIDSNNNFQRRASIANQLKLAIIVAGAKISDIQAVAKFPDWLGYIGLVINHCPDHEARKVLSKAFIPQFIEITKENKELSDYFKKIQSEDGLLSIKDLSRIESGIVN